MNTEPLTASDRHALGQRGAQADPSAVLGPQSKTSTYSDKKAISTTSGAIGISAFASFVGLCCIGPWAVILFGVPGAVSLARFQPFRPYILGVAVLMLAWSFWRVYRKQPVCEDGRCAAQPSPWLKLMLWLALVFVILALFATDLQWLLVDPTPEGLRQ